MKKLRVALIGAGQIARVSHIPGYQSMDDVEVAGICDTRIESAEELANTFHIANYYSDYKTMLDDLHPDAVSICVPNKFHCQITCDALNSGCHVLCEKPPAVSLAEAEQMERTAANTNRLLSFGFHLRHSKEVELLKKKIDAGVFGEIYAGNVQWLRRRGIPGWGNFTNKSMQGGGPLIDIGAHVLDLAFYLLNFPPISYVCATQSQRIGKRGGVGLMGSWNPDRFTVEDGLFGYIRFENGTSIHLETSFALNMKEKDIRNVQLFGDKLGASLFPLEIFGEENGQLLNTEYPFHDEKDLHFVCLKNFVQACLGNEKLLVTAKQGTYIQKVIGALYQSAESGEPVKLE